MLLHNAGTLYNNNNRKTTLTLRKENNAIVI